MSKAAHPTKVAELYGLPTFRPADWKNVATAQACPFLDRKCRKNRKSASEVTIGTCTMAYGRSPLPIMIRPFRLLERRQVFHDCVHLLTLHDRSATASRGTSSGSNSRRSIQRERSGPSGSDS